MEVHFVHYNDKYSSGWTSYDDGILVVGYVFEESGASSNTFIETVVENNLSDLEHNGGTATTSYYSIAMMIGNGMETETFYSWAGSLTTPTCDEAVSWYLIS